MRLKIFTNRSVGGKNGDPVSRGYFDGRLIRRAVKIVIFSPVTAPRAAALHRSRGDIRSIATVRCRLCNSLGRAGPSGFEQDEGAKGEWVWGGHGDIQMPPLLYGNTRDVKMTVRYAGPVAEILPAANASTKSPTIIRYTRSSPLSRRRPLNLALD